MKIGAFLLLFGRTKRPDLDWAKNSLAEGEGFIFLKVARRQSSPDSIGHSSNAFFWLQRFLKGFKQQGKRAQPPVFELRCKCL
jgi:hypothetical protein